MQASIILGSPGIRALLYDLFFFYVLQFPKQVSHLKHSENAFSLLWEKIRLCVLLIGRIQDLEQTKMNVFIVACQL